jgi:hypothetical protein
MTAPVTEDVPLRPRSPWGLVAAGTAVVLIAAVALGVLVRPTPRASAVLHTGTSRHVVTATVRNPRIGTTAVEIDLADRIGGPAQAAVQIQAVMPLMGHATPPAEAVPVGSGRYRAEGVPLMMTGSWELLLSIDVAGAGDHLVLPLPVSG